MPRVTPLGCNGDVATTLPTRRAGRRPDGADALPLPLDFVASDAPPASDATGRGSPPADLDALPPDSILRTFHPAVAGWFLRRFPGGPTEPQRAAWPRIAEGGDVLVASPTGTGKTLTGFLVAIDAAYRAAPTRPGGHRHGPRPGGGLRLAPAGPGHRRPREPAGTAGRYRPGGGTPGPHRPRSLGGRPDG